MKLISVNCPNCGKPINLDVDNLGQFCSSCGSKIVLDVETIQQLLIAKEETKRVQMNADRQMKLAQMQSEDEAKKWERQEKSRSKSFMRNYGAPLIVVGVCILLFIALFVWFDHSTDHMFDDDIAQHESIVEKLEDIEEELEEAIEAGDYDHAMILANKLRMDDGWSSEETKSWNEKREEYIRIINERKQAANGN